MRSVMLVLLAGGVVLAADPPGDVVDQQFRRLDTDGDGKLSAAELKAAPLIERLLRGADANGDDFLVMEEVRAHLAKALRAKVDPAAAGSVEPVRQGPRVLRPGDGDVGRQAPDIAFTDLAGRSARLRDYRDRKAVVVAFTSTSCPLSKKYVPALARLELAYADKGVAFVFVNPVATDEVADMKEAIRVHGLKGPYVHDRDGAFARAIGAKVTTDTFVLDPTRTVVYRGAIDDQYGQGYAHDAPRDRFLAAALDAVLADRSPVIAATAAPGCALDLGDARGPAVPLTYHRDVARIVQAHCVECHRKDGVAPFPLDSMKDVLAHAGEIRRVIERNVMPPWFAAEPAKGPSPWVNDRSLAKTEKADLLAWLGGDRAAGDPTDAPRPRTYEGGWLIGKPDAVVRPDKPVRVKAEGTMPYQNVTVDTDFGEDKWVQALEVRPGARQVVHHVLVFVIPPKTERADLLGSVAQSEAQGYYAIYVPGNSTLVYPDGFGKKFPKGSKVRFQIHYTPNGTATEDITELGMIFAREKPRHEVRVAGVVNTRFSIPPGADNHMVRAQVPVPFNARILGFLPHMHLRGKAFRYELTDPSGQTELLLDVPRYDFNWQLLYKYAEPKVVRPGSTLKATGWFDNSDKNPANPDPGKAVRWGPQTFDEMMLGYVEFYIP